MKVVFKILKAGSGHDQYFERLSKALNKENIKTEIIYYNKIFQFFPYLLRFFDKNVDTDIIHSSIEYGWVFKKQNTPLILTAHHCVFDKEFQKYTTPFQKIFHYLILKNNIRKSLYVADKLISVSKYTADSICKYFGKCKFETIHNAVDVNVFRPKINKKNKLCTLLFVGNLSKRKGFDLLPEIMSKLGKKYSLRYTGGLRNNKSDIDLKNVKSLGKISNKELIKEYQKCDALLFPTRLEGFGYSAVEAMSCGKIAFTTNFSSLPEIITNNKDGILCKLNNVNDFVEKIKLVSTNKDLIQKIENEARKTVIEKFNMENWASKYRRVYESI